MRFMNIFQAIVAHDLDRLAALLAGGADPNAARENHPRWTPLHAAIEELEVGGSVGAIVLLLRYGAVPDSWDADHDSTPLLMSVFRQQAEATRLLLVAGANPNVTGAEGDTPLRWCVEHRDHDTAAMLLRCGASQSIDSTGGPSGMSALGRAASQLDLRMIELLLAAGANPAAVDADLRTAMQRLPPRTQENKAHYDAIARRLGRADT
jgi:ankyrin repeat protein